jgi:hypothetical protein
VLFQKAFRDCEKKSARCLCRYKQGAAQRPRPASWALSLIDGVCCLFCLKQGAAQRPRPDRGHDNWSFWQFQSTIWRRARLCCANRSLHVSCSLCVLVHLCGYACMLKSVSLHVARLCCANRSLHVSCSLCVLVHLCGYACMLKSVSLRVARLCCAH